MCLFSMPPAKDMNEYTDLNDKSVTYRYVNFHGLLIIEIWLVYKQKRFCSGMKVQIAL